MQRIKKLVISNFSEIFSVFSLFIMFFILFFILKNHLGEIVVDCGREVYFPQEILQGKILYKDIFNIFGPLSYQINAALYKVFGVSLDTLRLAGAFNSLIIVFLLYGLSRLFTSREISWIVTTFIMVLFVFIPGSFNYIFPYAYAMTYALSALLFSILFLMLYLKTDKQFFVPLSWFFIGASISSKYDYVPYAIFLVLTTIFIKFYKKIETKYILYSIISFITIPVISFSILFLQGLTLDEFLNQLKILKDYTLSSPINYFYTKEVGLYPQKDNLIIDLKSFVHVFTNIFLLLGAIYFSLKNAKMNLNSIIKFILSFSFAIFFFNWFFSYISNFPHEIFSWLPLFTLFIFFVLLINIIMSKDYSQKSTCLAFFTVALISSMKSFFYLNFYCYGSFTIPLLVIANSIFIVEYLPQWFPIIDKKLLKKAFLILLSSIILCYLRIDYNFLRYTNYRLVEDTKGEIYSFRYIITPTREVINYIKINLKQDDSIWVIPEGLMINFLTNHSSNETYYNITPPYVIAFGEERIISDTKKTPPDYIIINNRDSADHGYRYLCEDYGFKICKYVKSSYTPVAKFGKEFKMVIYKKKI